jgi:ABC-2 type transport system ATP-binding protein
MAMIEADGLTKYYGDRPAVRGVSFAVEPGETVGFLGANGAGKSTVMRMLTGYLLPTAGRARIGGHDVEQDARAARRLFGYLPESAPLYRDMRVSEFLAYRGRLKGLRGAARRRAVAESLAACGVADVAGRIIGQLSKGYRQRVAIAECLLGRPPLLILDEPTVGLDPNQVLETRGLIRAIGAERTIFLSSHILHEVELLCDRVIVIDRGRVAAEGPPEALRRAWGGPRTLALQLVTDADAAERLGRVPGVEAVAETPTPAAGARVFTLRCAAGADPRREIARLAGEAGWLLEEMRLEPVRLETVFAAITAGRRADGADGAPADAEAAAAAPRDGEGAA